MFNDLSPHIFFFSRGARTHPMSTVAASMLRAGARAAAARVPQRAFSAAPASSAGISFDINDEQKAFQEMARKFVAEEVIPVAAEYDRTMEYPQPIFEKAWAQAQTQALFSFFCKTSKISSHP